MGSYHDTFLNDCLLSIFNAVFKTKLKKEDIKFEHSPTKSEEFEGLQYSQLWLKFKDKKRLWWSDSYTKIPINNVENMIYLSTFLSQLIDKFSQPLSENLKSEMFKSIFELVHGKHVKVSSIDETKDLRKLHEIKQLLACVVSVLKLSQKYPLQFNFSPNEDSLVSSFSGDDYLIEAPIFNLVFTHNDTETIFEINYKKGKDANPNVKEITCQIVSDRLPNGNLTINVEEQDENESSIKNTIRYFYLLLEKQFIQFVTPSVDLSLIKNNNEEIESEEEKEPDTPAEKVTFTREPFVNQFLKTTGDETTQEQREKAYEERQKIQQEREDELRIYIQDVAELAVKVLNVISLNEKWSASYPCYPDLESRIDYRLDLYKPAEGLYLTLVKKHPEKRTRDGVKCGGLFPKSYRSTLVLYSDYDYHKSKDTLAEFAEDLIREILHVGDTYDDYYTNRLISTVMNGYTEVYRIRKQLCEDMALDGWEVLAGNEVSYLNYLWFKRQNGAQIGVHVTNLFEQGEYANQKDDHIMITIKAGSQYNDRLITAFKLLPNSDYVNVKALIDTTINLYLNKQ